MANGNSPLNEQHFGIVQKGLEDAEEALRQIDLARQAGLDVSQFEQGAKTTRDKLLRIKNTYFPGR